MHLLGSARRLMLFSCLFLIAGFANADSHGSPQELLEQLNSTWNMHFNNADAKAIAGLYTDNAIVSPGNGKTLNNRAAIEKLFTSYFENGLHNHSIEIITSFRENDTITQVAKWQANGQESEGNKPVYGGILVSVFKKNNDGDWKAYLHLWNMAG